MDKAELLQNLIDDLEDTIDDYKDDRDRTDSKLKKYECGIRIDELRRFKRSLEQLLEECEDE